MQITREQREVKEEIKNTKQKITKETEGIKRAIREY